MESYYDSTEYILSLIEELTDIKTNIKTYELFRKLKSRLNTQSSLIEELSTIKDDYDDMVDYEDKYDDLMIDYDDLEIRFKSKVKELDLLQKAYDELQNEHKMLAINCGILKS